METACGSHVASGEPHAGDGSAATTVLRFPGARLSDRAGNRHLPIGDDGFERAMERSVVVDKSMLIADVLNGGLVTLFCRPRRFGKTFNMTMLKAFFEIPPENVEDADLPGLTTPNLFEGFEIWDAEGGRYRAYQGAFPVIYLSFNSIKRATWPEAHAAFAELIASEFSRHSYLEGSGNLSSAEQEYCSRMGAAKGTDAELANSLAQLALLLRKHHGKRVVVLIDEYDAPVMSAFSSKQGYYDDVVRFMKALLTGVLKDGGAALELACLTGVQWISKESIFSDLNNLVVNTPLSRAADERYGFTDAEVRALACCLGREDGACLARQWYDGYRFGDVEIYNPWSVLSYFANDCEPGTYWANTSSNDVIGAALARLDGPALEKIYAITAPGAEVAVRLAMDAVLPDLGVREDALWGMLYLAGYVTTDDTGRPELRSVKRRMRLPNMEIATLFRDEIIGRFAQIAGDENGLDGFHGALVQGDDSVVSSELEKFLLRSASYMDPASENSYHMLLLGMCFGIEGYGNPTSNRESGRGRYDIRIEPVPSGSPFEALSPCNGSDAPVLTIEVKREREKADPEKTYELLQSAAKDALRQIARMGYDDGRLSEAKSNGVRWGIAFAGKRCVALCEKLEKK